ncbi:hypothetical protein ABVT39_022858 [Epinephelus coioides]
MSHLCTMHRPPLSKERTGGDHFGERNSWRVEKTPISPPFKAPTTPQPFPPPSSGRGTPFEQSTFHVTPPVSHEEGGVQHLSLLRFMLERHTTRRRRSLRTGDLFSGQCGHTVSSMEDRITDQNTVLCCISCPLCSLS